jgi:hypothetical protein
VTPGRRSALSTRLTRGARSATASTAAFTTAMASSQSPSIVVNIESVWFGSPLARTTRTASATISPTPSPTPSGVTEKAMSMPQRLAVRGVALGGDGGGNPGATGSHPRPPREDLGGYGGSSPRETTALTFRS